MGNLPAMVITACAVRVIKIETERSLSCPAVDLTAACVIVLFDAPHGADRNHAGITRVQKHNGQGHIV
jgi:hypothetical protein